MPSAGDVERLGVGRLARCSHRALDEAVSGWAYTAALIAFFATIVLIVALSGGCIG